MLDRVLVAVKDVDIGRRSCVRFATRTSPTVWKSLSSGRELCAGALALATSASVDNSFSSIHCFFLVGHRDHHRRSKRRRRMTAKAFIAIRKASSTMMAAEVRSTKARSGLSAHR